MNAIQHAASGRAGQEEAQCIVFGWGDLKTMIFEVGRDCVRAMKRWIALNVGSFKREVPAQIPNFARALHPLCDTVLQRLTTNTRVLKSRGRTM